MPPGWEDVGDLYRVLVEVRILAERLTKAIGQLALRLERPVGAEYRCDTGVADPPATLVSHAAGALAAAYEAVQEAGHDLGEGQSA